MRRATRETVGSPFVIFAELSIPLDTSLHQPPMETSNALSITALLR